MQWFCRFLLRGRIVLKLGGNCPDIGGELSGANCPGGELSDIREKVMAARRRVSNLNAEDLGFNDAVDISHINLFDHLTPRMQELLFESKKFKDQNNYKYCWAKNGFVYLRKTDTSTAVKLSSLEDLQGVVPQS